MPVGAFLNILRPTVAIISPGASNSCGYPKASIPARLKASGAKVYRTDLDGIVSVKTNGETLAELGWDVVVIWQCRLDEAVGNLITQLHEPREPIDAK